MAFEVAGEVGEVAGGGGDLVGGGGDLAAGVGELFHGFDDLGGGAALLLGGHPYLGVGVGDGFEQHQAVLHLFGALFHRHHGGVGFALDGSDDGVDLAGGGLGPFGQAAYLVGDDGEPEAVLAGSGGFDGGVEGQQVGLVGDLVDQVEQRVDVVDLAGQGEGPFAGQR